MSEKSEFPIRVDRNVFPRAGVLPRGRQDLDHVPRLGGRLPASKNGAIRRPERPAGAAGDVGFGWPSVFGGLVEMPTAQQKEKPAAKRPG